MIEARSFTHTIRIFATKVHWTDLFRPVAYFNYCGDPTGIPFWYQKSKDHSCVTDLRLPMEELLGRMKSNTRNEIRRAVREGCSFSVVTDYGEFIPFYNDFCKNKGFADHVSVARLRKFPKLLITKSMKDGKILAMHATQLDPENNIAILILSGSQRLDDNADRKLIGWGNRYLHYKDLEWLKNHGYNRYDWSGVCLDPDDSRYSIGQFKLSFGGDIVDSWTLRTPLYVILEHVRNMMKKYQS